MTRLATFAVTALAGIALLWALPAVGVIVAVVLLVVLPPWGRTYAERAVISGIVILGAAAVIFPRAGSTPVDANTARLFLTGLIVVSVGLYLVPTLRNTPLPRLRAVDIVLLGIAGGLSYWLVSSYLGATSQEVLSGLFFSGWDNQGHFTTFANTYAANSTTWPTTDGTIAWNQWYPSLHTTFWALLEYAGGSTGLSRVDLLFPYVQWSAVTFAASVASLAWVASDLAGRWTKHVGTKKTSQAATLLAASAIGVWVFLGSPQFLFNSGFTNFVMGVAVVTTASYLSVRSIWSARTLGWFLVPLAAIAAINLWTPLVIVLVPAGAIVAISLTRSRRTVGIVWIAASTVVGGLLAWQQGKAILAADDGAGVGDFAESIGAVGTGMAPFNIAAGIAAPLVAIAIAVLLRNWRPLAFGVAAPSVMTGLLALAFIPGTSAAGVDIIQSYYVLKALDASLLATAPLVAAAAATGLVFLLRQVSTATAVAASVGTGIASVAAFGYVGIVPQTLSTGFTVAPGVQAGLDRTKGINDPLIGESIIATVDGIVDLPNFSPMMWDGAGTLPNLWSATLHEVPSALDQEFYAGLPPFPYGDDTFDYVRGQVVTAPNLRLAVTWFRESSEGYLRLRLSSVDPRQIRIVQVPMRTSLLCPECP